jgi:predicted transposase YbfD/YdcC
VDGKAQTGSKTRHSQETRTVGAYDLRGSIIGQTSVATKGGEPAALDGILTQLTSLDPGSIVFTMDAGLAGQTALNAITTHGQYWLVTIKLNRPNAHADLDSIPWADIPTTHTRTDTTHARTTTSHVKAVEFTDSRPSPIPSGTTVIRIDRTTTRPSGKHSKNGKKRNRKKDTHRTTTPSTRTTIRGGKYHTTHETVYIITSIPTTPNPAQHIYNLVRGHWRIEAIHWIRDVIFGEDASTLHAGYSPRLNAALNNFVISAIRARHGPTSPIKPHTEQAAADLSYAITLFAPLKQ